MRWAALCFPVSEDQFFQLDVKHFAVVLPQDKMPVGIDIFYGGFYGFAFIDVFCRNILIEQVFEVLDFYFADFSTAEFLITSCNGLEKFVE